MKVLVFGESGQLALSLRESRPENAIVQFIGRSESNLESPDSCSRVILQTDADVIVNAAAYTNVDAAESEPQVAHTVNALAPAAMAHAAATRHLPIIHISTDYVFSGLGSLPWRPDSAVGPVSVYGKTKLDGELAVSLSGATYATIRTSWVFSEFGKNFVKSMLRMGSQSEAIRVVGDQFGGPTAARDLAHAIYNTAGKLLADSTLAGTYHFCGQPSVSWAAFARRIFEIAELPVRVIDIATTDFPTAARRPANSQLNCQSMLEAFGIAQPFWDTDLKRVIKSLRYQS